MIQDQDQDQDQDQSQIYVDSPIETRAARLTPPTLASAPDSEAAHEIRSSVDEIFDYWRATLAPSAKRTPKRMNRIRARLAEGFTAEDLRKAIHGATLDDWLMGRAKDARPGGWRDLDTVLRDAGQVERLIVLATATERSEPDTEFDQDPDDSDPDPPGTPDPITPERLQAILDRATGVEDA